MTVWLIVYDSGAANAVAWMPAAMACLITAALAEPKQTSQQENDNAHRSNATNAVTKLLSSINAVAVAAVFDTQDQPTGARC